MNRLARTLSTALLLAAALAGAVPAQEGTPKPRKSEGYSSRYEIRYLGPHAAQTLGWDQCAAENVTECNVRVFTEQGEKTLVTVLEVFAPRAVHENISRALLRHDAGPQTKTFYVVLLAASPKPSGTPANLSAGANKALQDLEGFLPYRGYRVLDTTLLRGTREMTGRLVGPDGLGYVMELRFQQPGGPDSKSLYVTSFQFVEEGPVPVGPAVPNRKQEVRAPRNLIRSSFTVQEGETLVVGTSRIDGTDEVLILLLTASPAS